MDRARARDHEGGRRIGVGRDVFSIPAFPPWKPLGVFVKSIFPLCPRRSLRVMIFHTRPRHSTLSLPSRPANYVQRTRVLRVGRARFPAGFFHASRFHYTRRSGRRTVENRATHGHDRCNDARARGSRPHLLQNSRPTDGFVAYLPSNLRTSGAYDGRVPTIRAEKSVYVTPNCRAPREVRTDRGNVAQRGAAPKKLRDFLNRILY